MKFILLLSTLLLSTIASATPWNSFIGCYNTVSINGESVQPAKYFQSKIYEGIDQTYKTLDQNEIQSLIIKINVYDQKSDLDKTYSIEPAFINAPNAQISVGENSVTFEYRDRILNNNYEMPIWYVTRLNQNVDGSVTVSNDRYNISYLLIRTSCTP